MQCLKDSLGYLGSLLSPPTGHHGRLRPVPDVDDTSHSLQPKLPDAGGSGLDFPDGDDAAGVLHHWALLVAGSSGWGNYRHQSDVAHAYQVPLSRADTGTWIQTLIMMARAPLTDDGSPPSPFPAWVPRCSSGAATRTTTLSS